MLKRCNAGIGCKSSHPNEVERKRLWDYHTAKQKEDWESRGIPMLVNPYKKRGVSMEEKGNSARLEKEAPAMVAEEKETVAPVVPVVIGGKKFVDLYLAPVKEEREAQAASGMEAESPPTRASPVKAQYELQSANDMPLGRPNRLQAGSKSGIDFTCSQNSESLTPERRRL